MRWFGLACALSLTQAACSSSSVNEGAAGSGGNGGGGGTPSGGGGTAGSGGATGGASGSGASAGDSGSGATGGGGSGGSAAADGSAGAPSRGYALWHDVDKAYVVAVDAATGAEGTEAAIPFPPADDFKPRAILPAPDQSSELEWTDPNTARFYRLTQSLGVAGESDVNAPATDAAAGLYALGSTRHANGERTVLWTAATGSGTDSAVLIRIPATGSTTLDSATHAAPSGQWTATAVSVAPDGNVRLLWAGIGGDVGKAMVTAVSGSAVVSAPSSLPGNPPGKSARSYSVEPDGVLRIAYGDDAGNALVCAFSNESSLGNQLPTKNGWEPGACQAWFKQGRIFRGYFPPAL